MTTKTKFSVLIAGLLGLMAINTAHGFQPNNNLLPGNNVKRKVKSVQIGITAPQAGGCPAEVRMGVWIRTNKKGPVTFMIARKGQSVGAPKTINAVKGSGGVYLATYMQDLTIHSSIKAEYRALVADGKGSASAWAPLNITC